MDVSVSQKQIDLLVEYIQQLDKWNSVYNLTAIRDVREMVGKHLLDSLSILPFIVGDSVIDVGTGAGLPGIPIAILRPDVGVTVLDSNSKKTRFLTHIRSHLRLDNVRVVHARVEQFTVHDCFTTVTSRAFASLSTFVTQCEHLCRADGEIVAMLGKMPGFDETVELVSRVIGIESIAVPGVGGDRHIARIKP